MTHISMNLIKILIIILITTVSMALAMATPRTTAPALNDVALLLPAIPGSKNKVSYTLKANIGCYKWVSTRVKLVSITPLYQVPGDPSCSRSALITAAGIPGTRSKYVVLYIKCVLSSRLTFSRGFIMAHELTTMKILRCEVFVDDISSIELTHTSTAIYINERETLGILAYDSNQPPNLFSTIEEALPSSILKIHQRADEHSETDVIMGESVLVHGISTGNVLVTARLEETGSQKAVSPVSLKLSVFEALMLTPTEEIYVVKDSYISYELQSRKGQIETISLPNDRFGFDSTNNSVMDVTAAGVVHSTEYGTAEVKVVDGNMPDNVIHAVVNVVKAESLSLGYQVDGKYSEFVFDDSVVHLVSGWTYDVVIAAYDRNGNRIRQTDNLKFEFTHDNEYFSGSQMSFTAIRIGETSVSTRLGAVSVTVRVVIASPVRLNPDNVLIPLQCSGVQLAASGGDGVEYQWMSSDDTVASVAPSGLVVPVGYGVSTVSAASRQDLANVAKSMVVVDKLHSIHIVQGAVEVVMDSTLVINVNATNVNGALFHAESCHSLDVAWHVDDPTVLGIEEVERCTLSCTCVELRGLRPSNTVVHVRVGSLQASVTVSVYSPLHTPKPMLLTPGSSVDMMVEGGPSPWLFDSKAHRVVVSARDNSLVTIQRVGSMVYRIACMKLGDTLLTVEVGNTATARNPVPASERISVECRCRVPQALILTPVTGEYALLLKTGGKTECLVEDSKLVQGSHYMARNSGVLGLKAMVLDGEGDIFTNASTNPLVWVTSDMELAAFRNMDSGVVDLMLSSGLGIVEVSANLTGADNLGGSISLKLIDGVELSPKSTTLYNTPHHALTIHTTGGSGKFEFTVNNTEVGHLVDDQLVPLKTGSVRVSVKDSCFANAVSYTDVRVCDVEGIEVKTRRRVELGTGIDVEIAVLGSNGVVFPSNQYSIMGLLISIDGSSLALDPSGIRVESPYSVVHSVSGVAVGSSVLSASCCVRDGGVEHDCLLLHSDSIQISVHSPLKITGERILTMLQNSVYQVSTSGGPSSGVQIVYTIQDTLIANVDDDGVVRATGLGTTELSARAHGNDGVFGYDLIGIRVVELDSVAIQTPSTIVLLGEDVRVRVEGMNGENAIALASAGLSIEWSVVDRELLSVENGLVCVTVSGKSVGTTTLSVVVAGFRDTIQITVVDPITILDTTTLTMTHGSKGQIRTTKDKLARLSYTVMGAYCADTVCESDEIATVSSTTGSVVAGHVSGTVVVVVRDTDRTKHHSAYSNVCSVSVKCIEQLQIIAPSTVSVGSTVHAVVVPRDVLGLNFVSHDSVVFSVISNHRSLLVPVREEVVGTPSNSTSIALRALQQGSAVIKVSLRDAPYISDYVTVSVTSAITPALPVLHVGGNVTFVCKGESRGVWSSSNPSVFEIGSEGWGVGLSVGSAKVRRIADQSGVHAETDVSVVKVDSIHTPTLPRFISNLHTTPYTIPMIFEASGVRLVDQGTVRHNIVVQCSVEEVAFAHARVEGTSCIVLPMTSDGKIEPPASLTLLITVTDVDSTYTLPHIVTVPFKPAFRVLNPHAALHLGGASAAARIDVHGGGVEAIVEDSTRLSVQQIASECTHSSTFEIRVLGKTTFNSSVTFRCLATGQVEIIDVSYTQAARAAPVIVTMSTTPTPEPTPLLYTVSTIPKPILISILFTIFSTLLVVLVRRRRVIPTPIGSPSRLSETPVRHSSSRRPAFGSPWMNSSSVGTPYRGTPPTTNLRKRLGVEENYF